MNKTDFASLALRPELLENLSTLNYLVMTPIQAKSLPSILKGGDVIAQGKTGSGKTAAFGLGLLQNIDAKNFNVQSLVLCPTRELAEQVTAEIRKMARGISNIKLLTLCGGTAFGPQRASLEHGCHIAVGTPGRIEEHLRKGSLKLEGLSTFVLDEADRMLDMGFKESINNICRQVPNTRQTLLFSATFNEQVLAMAKRITKEALSVKVESTHATESIEQLFYAVASDSARLDALRVLLMHYQPESAVVFCNTKKEVQYVADELRTHGFGALAFHGDLDQKERDQTLVRFANLSASILVATDVAARGLDIESIGTVVNYQMPRDQDVHIHRIGRTGRAGSKGMACTLFSEAEAYKVTQLEEHLQQPLKRAALPPFSLLKQPAYQPVKATLLIAGGKKQKLRAGDILGALTGEGGISGKQVGKIKILDTRAYVAVDRQAVKTALNKLGGDKMKGKTFKVRLLPT